MNVANNLRSRTTKGKLRSALIEAMQDTPLSEIRINRLCSLAGVGRSTFYEHYESIEQLVSDMEKTFTKNLEDHIGNIKQYGDGHEALDRTILFFSNNKDAYLALLQNPGSKDFQTNFATLIMGQLKSIYVFSDEPTNIHPFVLSYATYGALYSIETWLREGCNPPADEFSQRLFELIRTSFDNAQASTEGDFLDN